MEEGTEKKKTWVKRLTNKYRLVILNDESFEEVSSVRLSRFNVYLLLSTVLVIIVLVVASAIFFTPLKEYIPGYTNVDIRNDLVNVKLKADSLEQTQKAYALYIENLQNIVNGGATINKIDTPTIEVDQKNVLYDTINLKSVSENEKKLREEMESESSYSLGLDLSLKPENDIGNSLKSYYFFPPLKGYVTNEFDPRTQHYGIDVVAPENEAIKAVMDGVVVMSQWTSETGYVIGLQHSNNLITLYKHNSVLLKKEGDYVRAGDVIAVIGNSGEQTSGPHLHFELWYNGTPINPKDYIVF